MLGLRLGDPKDENLGAWLAKESVRDVYLTDDVSEATVLSRQGDHGLSCRRGARDRLARPHLGALARRDLEPPPNRGVERTHRRPELLCQKGQDAPAVAFSASKITDCEYSSTPAESAGQDDLVRRESEPTLPTQTRRPLCGQPLIGDREDIIRRGRWQTQSVRAPARTVGGRSAALGGMILRVNLSGRSCAAISGAK